MLLEPSSGKNKTNLLASPIDDKILDFWANGFLKWDLRETQCEYFFVCKSYVNSGHEVNSVILLSFKDGHINMSHPAHSSAMCPCCIPIKEEESISPLLQSLATALNMKMQKCHCAGTRSIFFNTLFNISIWKLSSTLPKLIVFIRNSDIHKFLSFI